MLMGSRFLTVAPLSAKRMNRVVFNELMIWNPPDIVF